LTKQLTKIKYKSTWIVYMYNITEKSKHKLSLSVLFPFSKFFILF